MCGENNLISLIVDSCTNLEILRCSNSQLSTLDVSTAIRLKNLYCSTNLLTNLYLNDSLELLYCHENQFINLSLSGGGNLKYLSCSDNQLTTLDISNNSNLQFIRCSNNNLISLDLRNGNNANMVLFTTPNTSLNCISVDDTILANTNWTVANGNIDAQHYFSLNCNATSISEYQSENTLLKIVDVLGKESKPTSNTPLFYMYSDGTVEKKVFVE
jgi:hypothetical protein